jgi:hypothetical protein
MDIPLGRSAKLSFCSDVVKAVVDGSHLCSGRNTFWSRSDHPLGGGRGDSTLTDKDIFVPEMGGQHF